MTITGCNWTPRNSGSTGSSDSAQGSKEAESVGASESTPAKDTSAVGDGLILVHGGTFTMGSPSDEPWRSDDEAQHEVTVSDFCLSSTEVSEAEYSSLMGANNSSNSVPVTGITWYDAVAFCNALSAKAGLAPAYTIDGESVTVYLLRRRVKHAPGRLQLARGQCSKLRKGHR